jgi:hypothetical protein
MHTAHCTVNHRSQNQHSKPWSWADRDWTVTQTCFPLLASPFTDSMPVLLLVTPVPLFATLATATPLHISSNKPCSLQLAKGKLATGASAQVKAHDHAIALFNRPPSPRTQTNGKVLCPIPPPHRHHAIEQDPQNIVCLSGCQQRHSSRHVVRHASRTIPIPNFSASKQKVMGMLQMQRVSDSLATRRDAAPGTAQHNKPR